MVNDSSLFHSILSGLYITLKLSVISIIIAAGLACLMNMVLIRKNKIAKGAILTVIQIIKGIPILLLLTIAFYVLPFYFHWLTFKPITTAIVILSIYAAVSISDNTYLYIDLNKEKESEIQHNRIFLLFSIKEFGEVIKNSTLVYFIGVIDLFSEMRRYSMNKGEYNIFFIAAAIYILLYLCLYFLFKLIKKKFPVWNDIKNKKLVEKK